MSLKFFNLDLATAAPAGRLQARRLERQLFQQRLAGGALAQVLRTYNHCLGDVERELSEAAAEIQARVVV